MKTVYENEKEMLELATELHKKFVAEGNKARAAMYARRIEEHKANLARYA